ADYADIAEMAAAISFDGVDFDCVVRAQRSLPLEPELPAIGQRVGQFDVDDAAPQPLRLPPSGRVQAAHAWLPPCPEMLRRRAIEFLHQASPGDSDGRAGFDEPSKVVQIEVVGAKVHERIDRDHDIEEIVCKRQTARVGVDGEYAVLDACVSDATQIL